MEANMGYTHYYERPESLDAGRFQDATLDIKAVATSLSTRGLQLAGASGRHAPTFGPESIVFNGTADCGHPVNARIIIPWPSRDAGGMATASDHENPICGTWGGVLGEAITGGAGLAIIQTRLCNGNCSYEPFRVDRVLAPDIGERPDAEGRYIRFCKTAFRPYDLLVTAALLIFKNHFPVEFQVFTDGEDAHWFDAKLICAVTLGYGMHYAIDPTSELVIMHGR
jgi:hypothetical protein